MYTRLTQPQKIVKEAIMCMTDEEWIEEKICRFECELEDALKAIFELYPQRERDPKERCIEMEKICEKLSDFINDFKEENNFE
jgi:hypothetical protein